MPPIMQVSVPINQGDNNLYLATVYYTIKKIIVMHRLVREFVTSFASLGQGIRHQFLFRNTASGGQMW